jgi:hypothetical protein
MLDLTTVGVPTGARVGLLLRALILILAFLVVIIAIVGVLQTVWWAVIASIILFTGVASWHATFRRPSRQNSL